MAKPHQRCVEVTKSADLYNPALCEKYPHHLRTSSNAAPASRCRKAMANHEWSLLKARADFPEIQQAVVGVVTVSKSQ